MATEINKNRKYTKREKSNLVKKVTNATDVANLIQKSNSIFVNIKQKHLQ